MDDELISRRSFMKALVGGISAFFAAFIAWPFFSFLTSARFFKVKKTPFAEAKGFEAIPVGVPTKLNFPFTDKDAFLRDVTTQDVWVIKHSEKKATVFSPICPHLNCRVHWLPKLHEFKCPCHFSTFTINGKVISGPAPRGMDTLPHKIENGHLYVRWELFKPGIPQKIEIK